MTHTDTELPSLSVEQVQAIFGGEITNFSEVGGPDAPITVVSREEGSGTRAAFEELVMEHGDAEKVITDNALLQQSNGQVRTTVASTPNTIGYLSFGFLDDSTRLVEIDGALPSVANVKNGSYPIFRPLNMLTNGAPNELVQAFLDYILSNAGQEIVGRDHPFAELRGPGRLALGRRAPVVRRGDRLRGVLHRDRAVRGGLPEAQGRRLRADQGRVRLLRPTGGIKTPRISGARGSLEGARTV